MKVTADTLLVELSDGRTITAPLAWFPRLQHGTAKERSHWRFIGRGEGIHWPDLDEDISVEGLVLGNPLDKNTDIGAINNQPQLEKIRELVQSGVDEGAGKIPGRCCWRIAKPFEFLCNPAMPVYVAMLRGINVSGQNIIKMERLRESLAALGFSDVKTYIQSGNAVFKAAKTSNSSLEKKIAGKISADFGLAVPVTVRTPEELDTILKTNPLLKLPGLDETKLHVAFLSDAAPKTADEILGPLATKSERFAICGREIYLYCPDGYGETKLSSSGIEKKLSVPATTRNWKTVNTLFAMAQA